MSRKFTYMMNNWRPDSPTARNLELCQPELRQKSVHNQHIETE